MTTNENGRTAGNRSTTKHDHGSIISSAWSAIAYRLWVMSYSVEEARQRYADRRQLLRQAGACLALALLRLAGMRNE